MKDFLTKLITENKSKSLDFTCNEALNKYLLDIIEINHGLL